jgi:hypothetical protein
MIGYTPRGTLRRDIFGRLAWGFMLESRERHEPLPNLVLRHETLATAMI